MDIRSLAPLVAASCLAAACTAPSPFSLKFAPRVDDATVSCTDELHGFGPNGAHHIGMNDLRFFVSNIIFSDVDGRRVETEFDSDDFQYNTESSSVALVDLTNTEGSCASSAIGGGESTARTHSAITGTTRVADVATVSFVVGVPQGLMKEVIADNSAEDAPSPLGELHWGWAGGYRHFVFNFTIDGAGGDGYVHIGSTSCGAAGGKVLATQDRCDFINNPAVDLGTFSLETDVVAVDLKRLLAGLDLTVDGSPGVECHSSPMQPDCAIVFGALGLDIDTGEAATDGNTVFSRFP